MLKRLVASAIALIALSMAVSCTSVGNASDAAEPAVNTAVNTIEVLDDQQTDTPTNGEATPEEAASPVFVARTPAPYPDTRYEAEDAQMNDLSVYPLDSGGQAVGSWDTDKSRLVWNVYVPAAGYYELDFETAGIYGESANNVVINGRLLKGVLKTNGNAFESSIVLVKLPEGWNTVSVERLQGSINIDYLTVRATDGLDQSVYGVDYMLSNPNASANAVRLFEYLKTIYGSYTLAGQYASDKGVNSPEVQALYRLTGKYPAIVGIDLMDYSPSRVQYGAETNATEYALEWAHKGGILTLIWHWNAPKDLLDTKSQPWWDGYNTSATTFDLNAALNGSDPEGYDLILRDIDAIAAQLKRLANEDIPVLWRPLHEASGGWFWWGAYGAENYKTLWKLLYERLTNYHQLNNLIWVYNGQAADWYPGDEYVDIIAEDNYVDPYDYESLYNLFYKALGYTDSLKMIGLAENGVIPDPNLLVQDNDRWLFFITWSDVYVIHPNTGKISDKYNELQHFIDVYNSDTIITFDELPDLKESD